MAPLVEMKCGGCVRPEQTSSQSDSHMWRSGVFSLSSVLQEKVGSVFEETVDHFQTSWNQPVEICDIKEKQQRLCLKLRRSTQQTSELKHLQLQQWCSTVSSSWKQWIFNLSWFIKMNKSLLHSKNIKRRKLVNCSDCFGSDTKNGKTSVCQLYKVKLWNIVNILISHVGLGDRWPNVESWPIIACLRYTGVYLTALMTSFLF